MGFSYGFKLFGGGGAGGGSGSPGGSDTQVQFNNGGSFGGDSGLTYDAATDALTVAGYIIAPTYTGTNGYAALRDAAVALQMDGAASVGWAAAGSGYSGTKVLTLGRAATNALTITFGASPLSIFLPNQTSFLGSMIVGTGGAVLSHTSGTTGQQNTLIGVTAGDAMTTGQGNTALGYGALAANTDGTFNTTVGGEAMLVNTAGSQNVAVGYQALRANSLVAGSNNVAIGFQSAFSNTTGLNNTAVGSGALYTNQTGADNTAVGWGALLENTADYNIGIGKGALQGVTTGDTNIGIGVNAGYYPNFNLANKTTTGIQNTFIGRSSGYSSATQHNNSTAIGYLALTSASNQVVLGNSSVTEVQMGTGGTANIRAAIPSYANNAAAYAALGAGALYYTDSAGEHIVKISYAP